MQTYALSIFMMLESQAKIDADLFQWKLAYIAADPDRFTPILFPEAVDQSQLMDDFDGTIEYDLSPIATGEMNMSDAMEILKQFEVK